MIQTNSKKFKNKPGFSCSHCHKLIVVNQYMGTCHRNHCPDCLWSKHVDLNKSGDKKAQCLAMMEPIGLTFKQEGSDKFGNRKKGEIMIIHRCINSDKISINRIAADDNPETILEVFKSSLTPDVETKNKLEQSKIILLTKTDEIEIKNQLFGKNSLRLNNTGENKDQYHPQ